MKVHIGRKELNKALKKQKKKWTFFEERQFMENLLQTRFNFLIAVYALFFTAFFTCKNNNEKLIIAIIAFVVIFLMSLTILRIYIKVDALLSIIYKLNKKYTPKMIDKVLGRCSGFLPNVNKLIGIVIPMILVISTVLGIVFEII